MTPIFGPVGPKMVKMAILSHFRPKHDKKWVDPGQNGLKMVKKGHFWTPFFDHYLAKLWFYDY